MAKQKKSKSGPTRSTGQTVEKEPKKQEQASSNGVSKWINSIDLRIIPQDILQKTSNPHLDPDSFYEAATVLFGNPLVFCIYGLDDTGRISVVITGSFNLIDKCIYLEDLFDPEPYLKEIADNLLRLKKVYGAKAVKLYKTKILDIGG